MTDKVKQLQILKSEVDRIAKTTTFNEAIYPLNAPIPLYETTRTFITTDACTYAGNKYNIGDTITVTGLTNGNSDRIEVNNGDVSSSDGVYAEWRYFEWSYVDYGGMAFKPLKISDLKTDEDGYLYYENCLYSYLRIYAYYVINPDAWSGNPSFNNNSVYFNFKGDYGEGCGYARYMTVDDLQGSPTPIAIQAGISSTAGDKIPIYTVNATCAGLGITDVSVATQESSGGALDILSKAIARASTYRSTFGATQNRLEHAYNINKNVEENTQSSESVIRDTDIAEMMMEYSVNNILLQAGSSMLTQANQSKQHILELLN